MIVIGLKHGEETKQKESNMKMYTIRKSSFIKRVAYCFACHNLIVKFIGGGVIRYKNVPESKYAEFYKIDTIGSVGRYYNQNIKNIFLSEVIIPLGNTKDTNSYRMDTICDCTVSDSKTLFTSEIENFAKMFRSSEKSKLISGDIEQVFRVNGKIYDTEDEAVKATNKSKRLEFDMKVDRVMLLLPGELVSVHGFFLKDFLFNHREELKKIL